MQAMINSKLMNNLFILQVCDVYGNHVKEDEWILIRLDGLSFQDGSGISRDTGIDCLKKVCLLVWKACSNIFL